MNTLTVPDIRTTPFVDEVRALANACFDRFHAMTRRELTSETRNADLEAFMLIRTGFSIALRDAQRSGNELLALHLGELLNEAKRDGCYVWLNGLAIDGGRREGV